MAYIDLPILWLDEAVLAVDKPAGLLTLPDGYTPTLPHARSVLEPNYGRLWIVHRLDRQTSGVLVLARTASAHRSLNTQFEKRQVEKIYHAIVRGSPSWASTTVDLPLRVGVGRRKRSAVDLERGKPALTQLRLLGSGAQFSLVEARPLTGRTHQIRAHLAAIGHAIAGDDLYTSEPAGSDPGLTRPMLHARSVCIAHPVTGDPIALEAPYPPDFAQAVSSIILLPNQAEEKQDP